MESINRWLEEYIEEKLCSDDKCDSCLLERFKNNRILLNEKIIEKLIDHSNLLLRDKIIRRRAKEVNYYKNKLSEKVEFKYKTDLILKDIK